VGALRKIGAFLRSILVAVFGNVKWEAPGWARATGRRAAAGGRWSRDHKGAALGTAAALIAAGVGVGWGVHWWKHRPKPIETTVSVSAPELSTAAENFRPHAATIDFDSAAAPLKNVGKPITTGIDISPKIEGTWRWEGDREITFTPKAEWPIGESYTVKLAKKDLVAPQVKLDTYKVEFTTPKFVARISDTEFYQDPVDPNLKKVVATFNFTHPVDPTSFEKRVKMRLEPTNKEEKTVEYRFRISYDKWKTNAYVHSEPVSIPQKDAIMHVTLEKGTHAQRGGPEFDNELTEKVRVPGLYNFLRVTATSLTLVDNERFEPEQVMVVETTAGVADNEMQKSISAWVLPLYEPGNEEERKLKRRHNWSDAALIGPEVLKAGQSLKLSAIAGEKEFSTMHSFKYKAEVGRYVYVQIKKGLHAFGGYVLGDTYDTTQRVPDYPRQVKILHSGALLSMSGERKVSVYARDVPGISFEIARVMPEQIHHFFGQSNGTFAQPSLPYNFNEENLAEMFHEERALTGAQPGKPQYEALDLSKYLSDRRGLFVLKVDSWNPETKSHMGESDRRLILVSDLGILVKDAADGSHDVFVQSIHGGEPVGGATVQVLGKNGLAVVSENTDSNGHAQLPNLREFRQEKQPVLYVVKKGKDTSFLPFGRYDRYLNFSRFDVGGVSDTTSARGLNAYLFSDRGIYRPGDEIRVGLIVRPKDWRDSLEGVPLQVTITDARGLLVKKENIKLSASGFEEIRHTTPDVAPTGTYAINVYVVRDGQAANLLGSTSVRVREFLPDRMKISVRLSEENPEGWVNPKDLKGRVSLTNLYGTPATNRRVRAMIHLYPGMPSFGKYRGFTFFDPLKAREGGLSDNLSDGSTNDKGEAEFDLQLSRFAAATYRLNFVAEGFEAEGGRSVTAESWVVVSPLSYLIGYKPDGALTYLSKGSKREVELIALGPTGTRVDAKGLHTVLLERKYVSVLTRQDNGTYKYESVRKEVELGAAKPFAIAAAGTKYTLPTDKPGDYAVVVRNEKDVDLQRIEFTVAGYGNLTRSLEKNAELTLALKKGDFNPGDDIEMQIKAPFTGAGLITIEREKVFAYKWFKTDTTASVQTIKLPESFEGDGYVSVAFVRDAGSDEVFMSPLSYGVVPFSVSRARRQAKLTISAAELAKPGEPYRMKIQADRPVKMILFAIDEGILRVADYKTPDPLAFFFQKRALGVRTAQILDMILPEYARLLNAVAPGGDEEGAIGANLNPFKRKQNKPVAYWSGIIDAGPKEKEISYEVPDYFNGTLRVMAVAVAPDAIGTFEKRAIVRGDFVLSPNVPTFAAPGDEFDVPVTVANNVVGSGKDADVNVELQVSRHLEVVGGARQKVKVAEMRESSVTFKVRAKSVLGSGTLTFVATLGDKKGKLSTDLSVRPATPYLSTFSAGHLKDTTVSVPVTRNMHPEFRTLNAGISHLPLGLSHGLVGYLEKFPHGCTEQITSQVVPAVVLGNRPEFGFNRQLSADAFSHFLATLRTRQNEEGAFGMWAANPHVSPFASVYAMHVLLDARERGLPVSGEMVKSGMSYLQTLATADGDTLADERLRAYAIYAMTRNGMVTSNFAAALQKHAEANYAKEWKRDLTGVYLAATYKLLKQDRVAKELIDQARIGDKRPADYEHYDDRLAHDAQLLYVIARHFPERASRVTAADIDALAEPIFQGQYNTFTSAFTIMALEAYGKTASNPTEGSMAIAEVVGGQKKPIALPEGLLPIASFSDRAQSLAFTSSGPYEAYYLLNQRGFDVEAPRKEIKSKLEVFREYTDENNKPIDKVELGDEIRVHVRMRALGAESLPYIAIVDLLPGGFEPVVQPQAAADNDARGYQEDKENEGGGEGGEGGEGDDVRGAGDQDEGEGGEGHGDIEGDEGGGGGFSLPIALDVSTFSPEYGDVREDRVVLYGMIDKDTKEFVYAIKATNVGTYTVPPVLGDSMYDRTVVARGLGGKIQVIKTK
jgi:alpha-2-macroglobulin